MDSYGESIVIEIVTGGFILSYPTQTGSTAREVIATPRKLQQRVKELVSSLGLVADTADAAE